MTELGREIATHVCADWNELRAESVWAGVRPRRRRRIVGRMAFACVVAAAAVGGLAALREQRVASPSVAIASVEAPATDAERVAASDVAPTLPHAIERHDSEREHLPWHARELWYEIHGGSVSIKRSDATFETLELRDRVTELLHTADVMRLARQPAEAIAPLRRIVADHADDPRAALAAFTLGRVLLDDLDRSREAAEAFADAIRLAPNGELVEDALARRVEALARAGDSAAARRLAEQYVHQFPHGRRLRAVRAAGGLP